MKKFFIVLLFVLVLALFLPLITGVSYMDIYKMIEEKIDEFNREPYFNDIELEAMQDRNSNDNGAIKAREALEITKANYAQGFNKIYFNEDEETYIYKMPGNKIYLGVNDIVVLEERDFYEVMLFELDENNNKKVLSLYYVDGKTKEIYDEKSKPSETRVYKDKGLGFIVEIPVTYENNIMMNYLEDTFISVDGNQINIKPVMFNYVDDGISNTLFTLFIFDGSYDKDAFSAALSNSYYIGKNSKNTYVIVKSDTNPNYFAKAREFLNTDFDFVIKNVRIY